MESERATRTERAVRAFQEIAHASATSLDLHDLLGLMVDQALAVIHAEVALLRLLDRAGEHLELQVARGVPEEVVRQVRFRPGEGLAGRLLLNGEPLRGLNLQQDPRATQRDLARRDGWRAFAAVPLQMHHQPIGVWFMIRRERKPFSDQDLALLSSFADYASAAVERNALLYAVVREKHESETVIQASAHGILVVDGRGWVVNMNPALERLTGWTLREARGQPCCDIVGCQFDEGGDVDVAPVVCPLDTEQYGDDRAFLEYQLTTRDGQRIPVETSYGLIRDDDGELTRIVMVFRDISHQRELNRMRAELIANVSHELRTPLSLIKGYATTLLSPDVALDESETRRFLNNVSAAADHLGRMIDDLLFASRIETQQLGLQLRRFDLGEIIHKTLRWFRPHAGDCELVADLPAEDLQVYADPDRVEQVLVNLLSNAVKYSPGGGQVTVRARQIGDPPLAVIHVIDEGQGIAQKHLPRIFDRYYLTEDSRQGVGLGLYICRGLVEAMGGQIWVASEIGKGSTFSFSLPIEQEAS
ncbi:MAG: ATP-binding protein [Anaerolineae bacterium]